jgi:hypothetical protein
MLTCELDALLQILLGCCSISLSLCALRLIVRRSGIERLAFRRNGAVGHPVRNGLVRCLSQNRRLAPIGIASPNIRWEVMWPFDQPAQVWAAVLQQGRRLGIDVAWIGPLRPGVVAMMLTVN